LSSGEEIQVVEKNAKSFRGKFEIVSEDALIVRLESGDQSFERQSILRVSTKGGSHRLRNAALGAAIGAGVGLAVGAASDASNSCSSNPGFLCDLHFDFGKQILTPLGAAAGGLIGTATGGRKWREIYRSP